MAARADADAGEDGAAVRTSTRDRLRVRLEAEDVLACAGDRWYAAMRERGKHTVRAVVLRMPRAFVAYLEADGAALPRTSRGARVEKERRERERVRRQRRRDEDGLHAEKEEEEEEEWDWDWTAEAEDQRDDADAAVVDADIDAFDERVHAALTNDFAATGAFPKLNWSAPLDASFLLGPHPDGPRGAMRCRTPEEVYTLLKSSDFCRYDLDGRAFERCDAAPAAVEPVLVLRRFCDIRPESEFRLFVRDGALVVACQRDAGECFPSLARGTSASRADILSTLVAFTRDVLVPRFMPSFIADVFIDRANKPWVLDFGPMPRLVVVAASGDRDDEGDVEEDVEEDAHSAAILADAPHPLTTWHEVLLSRGPARLAFVATDRDVDRSAARALAMHRVPLELVSGDTAAVVESLARMGVGPSSPSSS